MVKKSDPFAVTTREILYLSKVSESPSCTSISSRPFFSNISIMITKRKSNLNRLRNLSNLVSFLGMCECGASQHGSLGGRVCG